MIKRHAEKIEGEELLQRAMRAGRSWHHHCLSPQCFTNDTDQEIIVLEMGLDTFYCDSTPELQKQLEKHAYQLAKPKRAGKKHLVHEALEEVRKYVATGTKWHFHITMPHCLLSMSDKYILILENDDTREMKQWEFDKKPIALVRAIDDYYLGRK